MASIWSCSGAGVRPAIFLNEPVNPLFFLGAGFMLLEAEIVSRMALLFGTTWVVNSIVVAGLLLLIVIANLTFKFLPRFPVWLSYVLRFATLAALYLIAIRSLLLEAALLRGVVGAPGLVSRK